MIDLRWRSAFFVSMVVLGLPAVPGCGDGKPPIDTSLTEATVSGIVMVKGVPAKGGTVLFNPSNSGRIVPIRTAPIGPDGTYTIKTLTGVNQVSFEGDLAEKSSGIGLLRDFAEVTRGVNKKDFDLLGEGGGKKLQLPLDAKRKGKKSLKSPPSG